MLAKSFQAFGGSLVSVLLLRTSGSQCISAAAAAASLHLFSIIIISVYPPSGFLPAGGRFRATPWYKSRDIGREQLFGAWNEVSPRLSSRCGCPLLSGQNPGWRHEQASRGQSTAGSAFLKQESRVTTANNDSRDALCQPLPALRSRAERVQLEDFKGLHLKLRPDCTLMLALDLYMFRSHSSATPRCVRLPDSLQVP